MNPHALIKKTCKSSNYHRFNRAAIFLARLYKSMLPCCLRKDQGLVKLLFPVKTGSCGARFHWHNQIRYLPYW